MIPCAVCKFVPLSWQPVEGLIFQSCPMSYCRGGLRFGSLAAVYYGVQGLMGVARAKEDLRNTVAAGLTSGCLFGALYCEPLMPPPPPPRAPGRPPLLGLSAEGVGRVSLLLEARR